MMDLRNWDPRQFGESVGYLPQDVQLFPASIKANIGRMREDARDEDVFDAAEAADVHELISGFAQGYETIVGMDGSPLSGGQRQRIGLARAFYGNPRLLVLDEPTTGLDITTQHSVIELVQHLHEELGLTVLLITHDINMIRSRVDRLVLLKTRLFAAGPPADVLKPDVLRQVYGKDLVITDNDLVIVEDYHHH
jgi:ATP-binding cassette subfamily C protein